MNNDLDVYHCFLNGDEKAIDELIAMYQNSLTAFICGFVKDYDIAESIMIDVFVDLIRYKGYKGKSCLKTYLFAIGRNKALRYLKNKNEFISLDTAHNYPSTEESLEEKLIEEERRKMVHIALKKLKPIYREWTAPICTDSTKKTFMVDRIKF